MGVSKPSCVPSIDHAEPYDGFILYSSKMSFLVRVNLYPWEKLNRGGWPDVLAFLVVPAQGEVNPNDTSSRQACESARLVGQLFFIAVFPQFVPPTHLQNETSFCVFMSNLHSDTIRYGWQAVTQGSLSLLHESYVHRRHTGVSLNYEQRRVECHS